MTPLVPFAVGLLGALISDRQDSSSPTYGATTVSAPRTLGVSPAPTVVSEVAPSRFTQGTALTNIVAAKGRVDKKIVGLPHSDLPTEPGTAEEELEEGEEEEAVDPQEVVRRQSEHELMLESLARMVVDDMEIGEYDEELEESLPTDEEFLAKYEPLDAPEEGDEEMGWYGFEDEDDFFGLDDDDDDDEFGILGIALTKKAKRKKAKRIRKRAHKAAAKGTTRGLARAQKLRGRARAVETRAGIPHPRDRGLQPRGIPGTTGLAKSGIPLDDEGNPIYGSTYYSARAVSPQRLDRIASGVFSGHDNLFAPGTGWGIVRRS
jgi:hypothetical protein